jgi:hypothetical protein
MTILSLTKRLLLAGVLAVLLAAGGASVAVAATPWWHMSSRSVPTTMQESTRGEIIVTAANLGDGEVDGAGSALTLTDTLPAGLKLLPCSGKQVPGCGVEAIAGPRGPESRGPMSCSVQTPHIVCSFEGTLPPFDEVELLVAVEAQPGASSSESNEASIAGGGAQPASIVRHLQIGEESPFGVEGFELTPEEEGGAPVVQAGKHPFQLTTTVTLNQRLQPTPKFGDLPYPVQLTKDLNFKWPAGLIGNPTPIPMCSILLFVQGGSGECPPPTVVGVALTTISEPGTLGLVTVTDPIFNLEPTRGEPARFGFRPAGYPVYVDASVRTGGDYGITVTVDNITQAAAFLRSEAIVWGVPGDPRHDNARGNCIAKARGKLEAPCNPLEEISPPPFLVMPTSCPRNPVTSEPEPLGTSVEGDSWEAPGDFTSLTGQPVPALNGCNRLPFEPSLKVTPDGEQASKPTGLDVDVHVGQEGQLNPAGDSESDIRGITVKLPAGVAINPSSADGLQFCSEGLVGFTGFGEFPTEPGVDNTLFSPFLPGSIPALAAGQTEPLRPGVNFCPDAAKVGEVTIHTPLLRNPIKGFVYLAAQESNPFGSVLAMYIVAEDSVSGSLVKLPGEVQLCQATGETIARMTCDAAGQIVTTFENNPQVAFEDAELHFFGGERAPLATPARCGAYTTEALYTPWSANPPVRSTSTFQITSGPNNTPCPGAQLPFNPSLTGGALNVNAGAYGPFTLTMTRLPGEQNLQSLQADLPPGLSGVLANVELCPEPQASEGKCGPNSLIGETTVSVGVGGEPFTVSGGKFYLTGPYNGTGGCTVGQSGCAPFGVTFVVPAKAGPFDLANTQRNHPACDCVLVRGKIEVDPITAAITITSNPPGTPDAIPTMIEGIPLEIQHVNAITTRSNFQFNPTNCDKMAVTGTIHSSEGASSTLSIPFQVTNCAALAFKPSFKVSTNGKTSKKLGASLHVKLAYPKAPFGSQANIKSVKVSLPKQLPTNLLAIQHACPHQTFEANPAGCESGSIVGHATATTPLLPVPLSGPAYFVSYGGAKFPELVIVLQGYGVTLNLHGETFINEKTSITTSTFHTVPDAPVGTFELTLPQGKLSALAAPTNLCTIKGGLKMPTVITAQNGMILKQSTSISVTGCPKVHKPKRTKTHHSTAKHK